MQDRYPNLAFILLFFIASLSFITNSYAADKPATHGFELEALEVQRYKIPRYHVVDGVVEAINQATLTAQTSGQVLDVNFDVEDFVKKGKVLMRFKDDVQRANLAQARAQLSEAQARLKASRTEYNRIKKSYEKRAVSASRMDQATADLDASKARTNAAKAATRQAQQQFDYTVVKAPYSGYVIERHIEPGEIANAGQPIMTGLSLNELRAVASVPQSYLHAIREHRQAYITIGSGADKQSFKGTNIRITPHADVSSHSFQIRVDLPEEAAKVAFPGTFAKVAFVTGDAERLLVPSDTVALRGEVRAVYVLKDDGTIFMRQVRIGSIYENMIEVLAGLEAGEQIITNPVDAAVALKEQRSQVAEVAHHD